jgi:hypothetical protein
LYLQVARQRAFARAHTEPLGGLSLRQRKVLDAVLGHQPSGFVG